MSKADNPVEESSAVSEANLQPGVPQLDTTRNQSVSRAIAILDLIASERRPMGVREIARALGMSATIVQRLINTLSEATYLEKGADGTRYVIGYRAFQMGNAFFANNNLHAAAMPALSALADREINGFLGILRGGQVIYLLAVESNGPISIKHRPGDVTNIHSTALGKALLAELGNTQVRQMLSTDLTRLTPQTIASLDELCAELDRVRECGYAVNNEENRRGVYSAGMVVRDATGRAIAALSGAVPTSFVAEHGEADIIRQIVEAAHQVSRRLGAAVTFPPIVEPQVAFGNGSRRKDDR